MCFGCPLERIIIGSIELNMMMCVDVAETLLLLCYYYLIEFAANENEIRNQSIDQYARCALPLCTV